MRRFVGLLVVMACVVAGCDKPQVPVSTEGADELVRQVLDAVASGNAETVYKAHFTPELKSRMDLKEWKTLADEYQKMLGPVKAMTREDVLSTYRDEDGLASATLQYVVVWEKLSGGVYVSLFQDGGWKIHKIDYVLPEVRDSDTDGGGNLLRGSGTPTMSGT